ncbi:MAG: glycerol kinase GlpK [Bacteroidales bacterium]|nr:MAG: glycerol kinase GlpK [Bacteroidales bacterium]
MKKIILALDAGTTSNRAILFDHSGRVLNISQSEFKQLFPQPGWVEHDPEEIRTTQKFVIQDVLKKQGVTAKDIAAIGITNQRETTVVWDKRTGLPVHNAIVWQDRRTAGFCEQLKSNGLDTLIKKKTGLLPDAYFSASKVKWILDNVPGAREKALQGRLAFGTVDSWLVWHLTNGRKHLTEVSNASRTMLFNIHTLKWDEELLKIFDVPESMLPEVKPSSDIFGYATKEFIDSEIPITGIAGDQQAALFGQMCIDKGMTKNTYGTGCFVMMNTGSEAIASKHNLLTTIAWKINHDVCYAMEGSIFIAGAVVQWLRDQLHIIKSSNEVESLARSVTNNGGVYFIPAFVGLGAPHWDPYASGTIIGITRGTSDAHIARAALEAIALQSMDVINTMAKDSGIDLAELRVDGGAASNNLLMQIQANAIQKNVVRPRITETTALGAAYLAGLAVGYWGGFDELKQQWQAEKIFKPDIRSEDFNEVIVNWNRALERSKQWNASKT